MAMFGGGEAGALAMYNAQKKLEEGIEDLRVKYEKKAEEDAKSEAERKRIEAKALREAKIAGVGGGAGGGGGGGAAEGGETKVEKEDGGEGEVDGGEIDDFEVLRAKRLKELKARRKKVMEQKALGHGEFTEVKEDEFLKAVTSSKFAACVFFHRDFPEKCEVMEKHMKKIAPLLPSTRLIKLDAEKAPFMVTKLKVRVIPSTICFVDGVAKDRIFGFSGLGGDGADFPSGNLVEALERTGCAVKAEADRAKDMLEEEEVG